MQVAERYSHVESRKKEGAHYTPEIISDFISEKNWSSWLREHDNEKQIDIVRRNINKNLPCGSDVFISKLEKMTGQKLKFKPIGRPKKG